MTHRRASGRIGWVGIVCLLLAVTAWGFGSAWAAEPKSAADFFKGATIRVIAPYAPGGSSDTAIRVPQQFFEKYTGARILVENMPGSGGYVGLRHIYSKVKPDGLTLGMFNPPGAFLAELMGQKEATWKFQEMSHIGRVLRGSGGIMMVSKNSSLRTLDDLLKTKREVKCATIDATTGSAVNAALVAEGLGLNFKIVPGFPNGKLCGVAVLRGEIEMTIQPPAGFEDEFRKGDLRAICIAAGRDVALSFQSLFASVPRLIDLPLSPDKKIYIALGNNFNETGFVMSGPPGIPKDRLQFLEDAFAKALKEPEVIKVFDTSGYAFAPLSGTEYSQVLKRIEKAAMDISTKNLNRILFEKYY